MTARSRGSSRTARCEEAIRGVGSVFRPSGDHGGDDLQSLVQAILRKLPAPSSSPHVQSVCVTLRPGDEQSL